MHQGKQIISTTFNPKLVITSLKLAALRIVRERKFSSSNQVLTIIKVSMVLNTIKLNIIMSKQTR